MSRVLITTVPFAATNTLPLDMLRAAGIEFVINPINRKLREDELAEMITDFDVVIAGTEVISDKVMSKASHLKLISRVGIGLDNVDLVAAKNRNILVSYTPDAPAPAVAELAIGLIFSLLRFIHVANKQMHDSQWHRHFGRRLSEVTVGIIGAGRIGGRVLNHLSSFGVSRILANDSVLEKKDCFNSSIEWVDKRYLYANSDVISLHIPLTADTRGLIASRELLEMKSDACIINTSRGGVINEQDLANVLNSGHLAGAAIDVFCQEPYVGPLSQIDRCILTSHMGSMTTDCRAKMEIEATQEAIRYLTGKPLEGLVPPSEFNFLATGM